VVILLITNVIYLYFLYEHDVKKQSPCVYQCMHLPKGTELVYFGESSNSTIDDNDSAKLEISGFINYYNPDINLVTVDTYAVHSGIYKYWIRTIKEKPKAIIVTMNLRSFGPAWINSDLETQLRRSVRLAKPGPKLWNRFLLSLKNPEDQTLAELDSNLQRQWRGDLLEFPYDFKYKNVRQWDNAMANGGWLNTEGKWDTDKITLSAHYIKAYAFNVKEDNVRVRDFDEIMSWANENNIKVLFNLLSENVAFADSLVGKDLVYLIRKNREFLVNRYTQKGAVVVDNLELVDKNDFIDKKWTTEHYKCRGRMRIAKNIVSKLKL
jgi:hypothetical protein